MTYIFNPLFFALTGLVDLLTTDLVEDNLDVLMSDVFGIMEDDVLATVDGDLTVVDFGNDFCSGTPDLIAAFFLLQPKAISGDNTMNLKT